MGGRRGSRSTTLSPLTSCSLSCILDTAKASTGTHWHSASSLTTFLRSGVSRCIRVEASLAWLRVQVTTTFLTFPRSTGQQLQLLLQQHNQGGIADSGPSTSPKSVHLSSSSTAPPPVVGLHEPHWTTHARCDPMPSRSLLGRGRRKPPAMHWVCRIVCPHHNESSGRDQRSGRATGR